ncbi:MAG TPA: hypothetical protein VGL19_04350 [Polyangiaceae bacterium]
MHRQTLRAWFGCCSLALVFGACSSQKADGGDGSGAAGGSVSGSTGTAGRSAAGGKAGAVGTAGRSGGSAAAGATGDAGSADGGSSGQVVGVSGGIVTQEGVTLDIPADALTNGATITVTTANPPAGYALASAVFQFGPDGTTFEKPVAVTIPLTSATVGAHMFWSNSSGGFDDIGGTVSGSSVTAYVTHFSKGFCAVPSNQGGGGASGVGGASGSAGASGTAGASAGGATAAGGASSGGGGAGGAGAGAGGASSGGGGASGASGGAGGAGASGASGASGAGGAGGASGGAGSGGGSALCNSIGLNLPSIKLTDMSDAGAPPDSSTYTGGTLLTGTYYETGDAHYGGSAYSGPLQAQYKLDTSAQTIQIGERANGSTYYIGMTYTQSDAHTLHATVVCNTSPNSLSTLDYSYTLTTATVKTLTMTASGSLDVMTFTAP